MEKTAISTGHEKKSSFSSLSVNDAMRRRVVGLSADATLDNAIGHFTKHKVNAILVLDKDHRPEGVVSKTEIIGAYYASFPLETSTGSIMSAPVFTCCPKDSLELALTKMEEDKIHRLYVIDPHSQKAIGTLAYPDIVGLLYRYCHYCDRSLRNAEKHNVEKSTVAKILVRDVMTASVNTANTEDSLERVIEELSMYRFGALLIRDRDTIPRGVISKTDLALAYKQDTDLKVEARTVMSSPVCSCEETDTLENGIHRMIFSEINRLFVYRDSPKNITGVLSLSDAAKARSGSCQACTGSRITVRT